MQFTTLPSQLLLQQRLKWGVFIKLPVLLHYSPKMRQLNSKSQKTSLKWLWIWVESIINPLYSSLFCFWLVNQFRIYGQRTNHRLKKHCPTPLQSGNKQNVLQEAQSCETFWMKHSVTPNPWLMCSERVTLRPVSDKTERERVGWGGKKESSSTHIKREKNEVTKEGKHPWTCSQILYWGYISAIYQWCTGKSITSQWNFTPVSCSLLWSAIS